MEVQNAVLNFSKDQLDLIIIGIYCAVDNKKFISNVRTLFNSFNEDSYAADEERKIRVYIIKTLSSSIIEMNISDRNDINKLVQFNGFYGEVATNLLAILSEKVLTDQYMFTVDKLISNKLKSIIIESKGQALIQKYNTFISKTYPDSQFDIILNDLEQCVDDVSKSFKRVKESMDESRHTISSFDGNFINLLDKMIKYETNPASKIKTGIKLLNNMFNGGFENGRVYCALGTPKGWKSGFMFNCAVWTKKYNKNLKPKDPNKKPVVLYLTLENTETETLRRAVTYANGNTINFTKVTKEQLHQSLLQSGFLSYNDSDMNEIGIVIKYAPNKSVTVSDIGVMLDDLEKQGCECVFLIVDYLKRIKPSSRNKELRIELGEITDELTVLAKEKDIPILTAMQLNRGAMKELNDTPHDSLQSAISASRNIGASNIAESVDVIQNVDCAFTVSLYNDQSKDDDSGVVTSDKYLILRSIAVRFNTLCQTTMFTHRFEKNNGMRIIEDINMSEQLSIDMTAVPSTPQNGRVVSRSNRW